MPINHKFVNGNPDSANPNELKASHWNADHFYPAFTIFGTQFGDDPYTTLAPPAAVTEIYDIHHRTKVDLSYVATARIFGNLRLNTPNLAWRIAVQYSLDGVAWSYLDGVSGPFVVMQQPGGLRVGAWVNLAAAAKADVFVRWVTSGGNGSAAMQWYPHFMQVR